MMRLQGFMGIRSLAKQIQSSLNKSSHFHGSLFLPIGDFFCFEETNFCDWDRLVFLAGKKLLRFSESPGQIIDNIFIFIEYVQ